MKKNFILSIIIFLTNIILACGAIFDLDCSSNFKCEFNSETGVLTISGSGDFDNNFRYNSFIKSVIIKNGITAIGNEAFYGCSSLTSITIPESVTKIEDGAFEGCSSLSIITIPNLVTKIGYRAFKDCGSLTSITIPKLVTEIGTEAFSGCNSLTSITVDSENSKYSFIEGVLFNKEATELIKYPPSNTRKTYEIPSTVTRIGNEAFSGSSSLTSVTIPNSVAEIGTEAFSGCSSLTSITIPNLVSEINNNVFSGCSSLTSITISNSVTYIRNKAFKDCSSLTLITIPKSVTSIGNSAFEGCSSLISITVDGENSKFSSIDGVLFNKDGTKLVKYPSGKIQTSYEIPASVTIIGDEAFKGRGSLASIIVDNKNQEYSSIDGVLYNKDGTELIKYPPGKIQTTYEIPASVTKMEDNPFYGCDYLTSITVESGNSKYSSIDGVLFNKEGTTLINYSPGNTQTSYKVPDSVTKIGYESFDGCSYLTSITIPGSVEKIEDYAFNDCISLKNVIFDGKKSPSSGSNTFSNTKVKKISVPIDYMEDTCFKTKVEPIQPIEPGYYINKADENTYIKCTNSGCEIIPKPTKQESCTSDHDGKLIHDGSAVGLCTKINELITENGGSQEVKENHYTVIPFDTTETNYLVHHSINGEVFNFDRTPSNVYYVVKSNENAIVFNPKFKEKDHCADKDGKLMERVEDFCSENSSGMYYTCVNGKCTSEYQTKIGQFENNGEKECTCTGTIAENCVTSKDATGYYLYESDLYEYKSGDSECTKVNEPADGYYWNDHQYNQFVECVNGSCKAFTPNLIADTTDTQNSDLIVDTGYNIIFNGESLSLMIKEQSNENYQYKISGHPDTALADPNVLYSIKFDKNSITIDGLESTIDDPNANVEPGFYKIANTNKYKQCDSTGCNEVTLETECKASTIGKLFTKDSKVALCLNFFDNQPIWTYVTTTGKYFMKYHANNNIFGLSNDQYGLIKITQISITLSEESKVIHYRYTTGDQKVLTEESCVASKINEFKIVEGETNIYTLSCTEQDETGLCKKT